MSECTVCRVEFMPWNSMQQVCGIRCAQRVPVIARKKDRADTKRRKDAVKSRGQWQQEAQQAFNAWIRVRDSALPCISCGRMHEGQWHAGHYLSTGARPELRFDEQNVHRQCQPCNTHLHGNLVMYRAGLVERIGINGVLRLEGPHPTAKLSVDDLRAIRDDYRARAKSHD